MITKQLLRYSKKKLDASNKKIISKIVEDFSKRISLYDCAIDAARSSAKIQTEILDSVNSLHEKFEIFTNGM